MIHGISKIACAVILLTGSITPMSSLGAEPTTDQILAMAREYLGGDVNLRAVQTIQFHGTFTTQDSEGEKGEIIIYLKKPFKQRLDVMRLKEGVTETTAINNIDGWVRRSNNKNDSDWTIRILSMLEFKRMRANTFDNLNFYHGIEKIGGYITNKGKVQKDGKTACLLHFQYDNEMFYDRYFDINTGELLATINDKGIEIKDKGEFIVDGIRFPCEQVSYENGKKKNTLIFAEIIINHPMDDDLFELPSLRYGK